MEHNELIEAQLLANQMALEQNQLDYRQRMSQVQEGQSSERVSGFPMPELYNQHYINSYSFPKGLIAGRKKQDDKKPRQSIYDMYTQPVRKGVSGWKLTKRMVSTDEPPIPKKPLRRRMPGQSVGLSDGGHGYSLNATIANNLDENSGMLPSLMNTQDASLNVKSTYNSLSTMQVEQHQQH